MSNFKKASYINPAFYHGTLALPKRLRRHLIKTKGVKPKYKRNPVTFKTNDRATCLLPLCVGLSYMVSNGRIYIFVFVSDSIVGHKLGEFCGTRRRYYYRNKKRKNTKRR